MPWNGWAKMNPPLKELKEINRLEKRLYVRCAGGMLAGIVLLAAVWNTKGVLPTIIGTAGIVLAIVSLLALFYFIDTFYKIKRRLKAEETGEAFRETYIEWPGWLRKWGGILYYIVITLGIGFLP